MAATPGNSIAFVQQLKFSGIGGVQTYGFGGGNDLASDAIPAGGFAPFAGLFAGTGPMATPIDGASVILTDYSAEPSACPPAAGRGRYPGRTRRREAWACLSPEVGIGAMSA